MIDLNKVNMAASDLDPEFFVQAADPGACPEGSLWFDSTNSILWGRVGESWVKLVAAWTTTTTTTTTAA